MNIIKKFLKPKGGIFLFFVLTVVFLLTLASSSSSRAQINFGDNPNFDPYGPGAKVIIVAPPGVFTLPKSATNMTRVCSFSEAINLILEVTGKNKIEFEEPIIDMCDSKTIENLDQYIQLDKIGEVTVDSDTLPYLKNKSSRITMRDLPFAEEPDIEVDGRPVTDQDIEDKSWDKSSKTLTFGAKHFTTYKAVARSSGPTTISEEEQIEEEQQQPSPSRDVGLFLSVGNIFLILIIIAIVLVVVGIVGYLVWRKK